LRDISPSSPWNAYLALYIGTSGSAGGGGGGAAARGGAGGGRVPLVAAGLAAAAGVGLGTIEGAAAAGVTELLPGRGRAAGLGLGVAAGLFCIMCQLHLKKLNGELTLGPPARKSLPSVIGLTTPGFLLAGGREVLFGGSPEAT